MSIDTKLLQFAMYVLISKYKVKHQSIVWSTNKGPNRQTQRQINYLRNDRTTSITELNLCCYQVHYTIHQRTTHNNTRINVEINSWPSM